MMTKVTFYDHTALLYSSYYISGFLLNQKSLGYRLRVSKRIPEVLKPLMKRYDLADLLFANSFFRIQTEDDDYYICIDAWDKGSINPDLLSLVKFYFKVNYDPDQIDRYCRDIDKKKIKPALPFFQIYPPSPYLFYPSLFPFGEVWWIRHFAKRRIYELHKTLAFRLEDYRRLRNEPRNLDVFFLINYNFTEQDKHLNEFRYEIIRELKNRSNDRIVAGFVANRDIPGECAAYQMQRMPVAEYIRNLARSKINIYVRGNENCISVKFGHFLSMAKPIVGETLACNKEQLYSFDGFKEQFAHDDPAKLAAKAFQLLEDPIQIEELRNRNASTFDQYFTPQSVGVDILGKLDI